MSRRASSSLNSSMAAASLSNPTSEFQQSPASEVKWQTLIDNILTFIDNHPRPYPLNRMEKPFVPTEFTSRESPLEVCAVEVCPSFPEFMIVGTYALVGKDDEVEHEAQIRKGAVSIMAISAKFRAKYAGMLPPLLDKKDFPAAILDVHFHPKDETLLGVATSGASVHFFRVIKHASVLDRRIEMKLLPLGWAKIADDDEHGLTHLITQFCWLPDISITGKEGIDDQITVTLAATESSGRVQIVKLAVSGIRNDSDKRLALLNTAPKLAFNQIYVRNHEQEAWTVSTFDIPSPPGTQTRLLLSGGDDSALKTTLINLTLSESKMPNLDILATPAIDGWADFKSHGGGVTAILPLPPTVISSPKDDQQLETTIPLLTGSYDDTIRLYLVNPSTLLRRLTLDLRLGGGVWRLKLMDDYEIVTKHHFLILASCMHGGVRILRLCYEISTLGTTTTTYSAASGAGWTLDVIARFENGHKSMVYACDFRREDAEFSATHSGANTDAAAGGSERGPGVYTIISTSFYDKKICTWRFVDKVCKNMSGETRVLGESGSWEMLGQVDQAMRNPSLSTTSSSGGSTTVGWVKEEGEWRVK